MTTPAWSALWPHCLAFSGVEKSAFGPTLPGGCTFRLTRRAGSRSEPAAATDLCTAQHDSTCLWGYRRPVVLPSGLHLGLTLPGGCAFRLTRGAGSRSEPAVATDLCTAQHASICLWGCRRPRALRHVSPPVGATQHSSGCDRASFFHITAERPSH